MPKISDLPAATSVAATDVLPVVTGSTTKKASVEMLAGKTGKTLLDFGAFPGASDASVAVTGQAGIVSGSVVSAWIIPEATVDHSADEHILETLRAFAGNIVAGTGFTIYGVNDSQRNEPIGQHTRDNKGGAGTRLYGKFTVGWAWR